MKSKNLTSKQTVQVTPLEPQLTLDLGIEVERSVAGIEMGVLANGISFLSQNGLAKMCGVSRKTISDMSREWEEGRREGVIQPGSRLAYLHDRLSDDGYRDARLYIECAKGNTTYHAYPDVVCMAVIEFFAFEARNVTKKAQENFRKLAQYGFRQFVYNALHYVPEDKWRYYQDRVSILRSMDSVPDGHFTVFHEIPV